MNQIIATNTEAEVPLIVKVRRRIEDRLRKDEEAVKMVAKVLKVKVTE